jgi:hypothetical protein
MTDCHSIAQESFRKWNFTTLNFFSTVGVLVRLVSFSRLNKDCLYVLLFARLCTSRSCLQEVLTDCQEV